MAEDMPVFLEHVQCLGSETLLRECMNTTTTTGACGAAAGVTCKEISSEITNIILITLLLPPIHTA